MEIEKFAESGQEMERVRRNIVCCNVAKKKLFVLITTSP